MTVDIAEVFTRAGATGFLHAREIGETGGNDVAVRADEPVVLASVFKILVLVAFAREVDAGRLDPAERRTVTKRYRTGGIGTAGFSDDVEASWRDLALMMMTMSDNAATDTIYHRVGHDAVEAVANDLGLKQTRIIGCCEDLFASVADDLGAQSDEELEGLLTAAIPEQTWGLAILDPLRTSASTPREVTTLLNAIWTDQAATSAACAYVRQVMAQQIWPHRLTSGFPADVAVAAKTGTVPAVRNEAGVVSYPDGRQFAVAVFTRADTLSERLPAVDASIGIAGHRAVELLRVQPQ